jgi:phosphomevalonate kinase
MKIFKNRFTEKQAAKVIEYFEAKAEEKIKQKKEVFMTKDDKVELISRIESTRADAIK